MPLILGFLRTSMRFSSFDICYLAGRETFAESLFAGTGRDAEGGVLTTECTIQIENPFAWAILYNIRAAA